VHLEIAKATQTLAAADNQFFEQSIMLAKVQRDFDPIAEIVRDAWQILGKNGYDPNEPRVPAGNPDGGQWTKDIENGSFSGSQVTSDLIPGNTWKPEAQYAQINVQNNAKTNNPAIDGTTETLLQTLVRIYAIAGDGSGPWYGTRVHLLFANDVRSQNLPGIGRSGVEQSFSLGDIADYGEDGTVRVDVYMRDETGEIIAIWDVKTGGAVLTGGRVMQLREDAGVGADVPVIELHATRGATRKLRTLIAEINVVAVARNIENKHADI
jgi:hypothetical protein